MTLGLVFDLDDTLYPEREYVLSGFRAAASWLCRRFGGGDLYNEMVRLHDQGYRGKIFDHVVTEYFPKAPQDTVPELVKVYRNCVPAISLYSDAAWAIDHYCSTVLLGLITDGYLASQKAKVKALGLENRLDHIVYTDAFGGPEFWKPHAAGYLAMERALDKGDRTFVYVADNPRKDFIAPNKRGWITIQIVREGGFYGGFESVQCGAPRYVITSLHSLVDIIGPAHGRAVGRSG